MEMEETLDNEMLVGQAWIISAAPESEMWEKLGAVMSVRRRNLPLQFPPIVFMCDTRDI